MTDFVLEQCKDLDGAWDASFITKKLDKIHNYSQFLKQPLKLEMFVPCDEEGNVLEPVIQMDYIPFEGHPTKHLQECYEEDLEKYNKAKQRVLFKNVPIFLAKFICSRNDTIEDIASVVKTIQPLTLSKTALKQIGL